MPISDLQMNQAMQAWQVMTPEQQEPRKAQMRQMMDEFRVQKISEENRLKNYFLREDHGLEAEKLDKFNATLAKNLDPVESKASLFNGILLSRRFGVPEGSFEGRKGAMMQALAEKEWGYSAGKPPSEQQFFNGMKSVYALDEELSSSAVKSALSGVPTSAQGWAKAKETAAKSPAWYSAREGDRVRRFALDFRHIADRIGPHNSTVNTTVQDLQRSMGVTSGEHAGDDEMVRRLMSVPEKDRDLVLSAIVARGASEGDSKTFAQKFGERFARGAKALGLGLPTVGLMAQTMLAKDQARDAWVEVGTDDPIGDAISQSYKPLILGASEIAGIEGIGKTSRPLTKDEQAQVDAAFDSTLSSVKMWQKLNDIAENDIDPATSDYLPVRGLLNAAQSLPMTIASFVPGAQIFMAGQFANDNFRELDRVYGNSLGDRQKLAISIVGSPAQAFIEIASDRFLMGRLPNLTQIIRAPITTWGGLAARSASTIPLGMATETIEEVGQDITPHVLVDVIGALQKDMPDAPWGEIGKGIDKNKWELFWSILPMVATMSGGANMVDFANGRSLASDPLKLQAAGLSEAAAAKISEAAKTGDWQKAQDLMRAEWKAGRVETDGAKLGGPRQAAAAAQRAEEQRNTLAGATLEAAGIIPTLRQTSPGKWRMELRDEAGTILDFDSFESAHQARNAVIEERGINLHQSVRQYIEMADQNAGLSRAYDWEFRPEERSLRHAVNEGEVSETAANRRVGISDVAGVEQRQKPGQEEDADFEVATAAMEVASQTADDRLASTFILGSNKTEFREGVHRTVVKLYAGATALTVVEEKVEGDADVMLAQGRRDWMIEKLRSYEQQSGDKLFTTKDNSALKNDDVREAWSHFAVSYFAGKSKSDQSLPDAWKAKGFRKVIADTIRSGMGGVMTGYATFFRSVFRRAAKIGKVTRDGKLDADFETAIARSLGLDQQVHEAGVVQEAANMAESLSAAATGVVPELDSGYELDPDNAPFSVITMPPVQADTSAFGPEMDRKKLREIGEEEYKKLVGTVVVNDRDGRKIRFSGDQFGKPKSHSADPRIMRIIPALPQLLKNGILLDTRPETDQQKYGNIKAWHTYGARANLDGQPLLVQLSTFELQDGTEMVSLYHDHNVLSEEAVLWGLRQKNVESAQAGPTDPVTNRAVSQETLDRSKLFQLLKDVNIPDSKGMSVITGSIDQRVAAMFDPFQRSPELRGQLGLEMQRRASNEATKWDGVSATAVAEDERLQSRKDDLEARLAELEQTHNWQVADLREKQGKDLDQKRAKSDERLKELRQNVADAQTALDEAKQARTVEVGGTLAEGASARDAASVTAKAERAVATAQAALDKAKSALALAEEKAKASEKATEKEHAAARDAMVRQQRLARERLKSAAERGIATDERQTQVSSARAKMLASIRTLDAILSALPAEVRGRVGGYARLASLTTDEARLKFIQERAAKIDEELEKFMKKDFTSQIEKALQRYTSQRSNSGQMRGKMVSTYTEQVDYAELMVGMSKETQDEKIAALEKVISESDDANAISDAVNKLGIAELFYDFKSLDAQQLDRANKWLKETIETGKQSKKILDEARRERINSLKDDGKASVLQGADASLVEAENLEGQTKGKWWGTMLDNIKGAVSSVMWTAAQQLELTFGQDSAITQEFTDRIITAANLSTDIKRNIERQRATKMQEIFGTKSAWKLITALAKLQQGKKSGAIINKGRITEEMVLTEEILERLNDGAITPQSIGLEDHQAQDALDRWAAFPNTTTVTAEKTVNAGREVEVFMSEMEAVQYLMSWNQPDVRKRMERHGWSEESMNQVKAFISPEAAAIGQWMSEVYEQGATMIDPVYRRIFNAPLPRVKNYAPTVYNISGSDNITGPDQQQMNSNMSASFTKARRSHNAELRRADALSTFLQHWEHVSHWVAYAELVRDMKAVLADTEVQNAVRTMGGAQSAQLLKTRVKQIEAMGNQSAWSLSTLDGFMHRFNQWRAFKGLAFRVSPVAKQTSAVLNPLLADIPAHSYAVGLAKALAGKLDVAEMWRSDTIQRRIEAGFSPEARLALSSISAGQSGPVGQTLVSLMQKGMLPMQLTDAGWTSVGAAIGYDFYRGQALAAGAPEEIAHQSALRSVDRMIATSAQPVDAVHRSLSEGDSNPFKRTLWMFASESRKTLAIEMMAIHRLATGRSKNKALDLQRALVAHVMMASVTQLMSAMLASLVGDDDDAEREWSLKAWTAAILAGPINGIFLFGDAVNYGIRRLVGTRAFASSSPTVKLYTDAEAAIKNFSDLSEGGDAMVDEIFRLSGTIGGILGTLLGPAGAALDVVLGNSLKEVDKVSDAISE